MGAKWGMRSILSALMLLTVTPLIAQTPAGAPAMPGEYASVLQALGRTGDFKDNVLKVNVPRNDLKVSVEGVATPTPFGFGGWVGLTKGDGGMEVTALHNHFFYDTPRVFYMHVHGHGSAADLTKRLQPALALIGKTPPA